jgi:hypothetical protein
MPHPDYRYQAHVLVACSGQAELAPAGDGPRGKFTSKSQTRLAYAVADVRAWEDRFSSGQEAGFKDEVDFHVLLEEANCSDVRQAVTEAIDRLDHHFEDSTGGSLNLVFSGHAHANGDLALADGPLSPTELMEWCASGCAGQNRKTRHLRIVIDSCYAGATLARLLLHEAHWERVVIRDGYAACLPSEEAYELDRLGHSVLTYTMLRPYRNALPPRQGWSEVEVRAVRQTWRESTQYLTNGRQHAVDVVNGHFASLRSNHSKGVDIDPKTPQTLDELLKALDELGKRRRRPLPAASASICSNPEPTD